MKYTIMLIIAVMAVLLATHETYAQAVYGPNGQYLGYQATTPNGVTTTYTPDGRALGSQQVDNGQTNYYSPAGDYRGTVTAPVYIAPNVTYSTPRQMPVMPQMKGW